MIYERFQVVKTLVSSEELNNKNVVYDLLKNFKNSICNISIVLKKETSDEVVSYPVARIIKVEKNMFDLRSFKGNSSLLIKDVNISDINKISVNADLADIAQKEVSNKYDFLDC